MIETLCTHYLYYKRNLDIKITERDCLFPVYHQAKNCQICLFFSKCSLKHVLCFRNLFFSQSFLLMMSHWYPKHWIKFSKLLGENLIYFRENVCYVFGGLSVTKSDAFCSKTKRVCTTNSMSFVMLFIALLKKKHTKRDFSIISQTWEICFWNFFFSQSFLLMMSHQYPKK